MSEHFTTKQVFRKPPNPTGKGGFQDHPELRSPGGWKKENTFHWNFNNFKAMTEREFEEWGRKNPKSKRTVAQSLAYERVMRAKDDLKEFQEVADRSEGKPKQNIGLGVDETISGIKIEIKKGDSQPTSDNGI